MKFLNLKTTDPYRNLAIEEYLFLHSDEDVLMLWQNEPTVVIGKNQNAYAELSLDVIRERGVHVARRITGGGAVYHDLGNVNFSLISTTKGRGGLDFAAFCQPMIEALATLGICAELSGRNDLLVDGKKFSGNAFYNSKGKSYQHGTILIDADFNKLSRYLTPPKAKLEAKGVKSVKSRVVNLKELSPDLTCDKMKEYLLTSFEEVYNLKPVEFCEINENEVSLTAESYSSWDYLYGKQLPFNAVCQGRLSFGSIEIQMQVEKSVINAIKCYTDALDTNISYIIENALNKKALDLLEIQNGLEKELPTNQACEILNLFKEQLF